MTSSQTYRLGPARAILPRIASVALTAALACSLAPRTSAQLGFSVPTALNSNAAVDTGFDGGAHVVTSCTGTTLTVWSSRTDLGGIGTDADILFARSSDGGATWSAPMALNTNANSDTGSDFFPRAATDDRGNWVVVWRSHDSLGGTIGSDADIVVARSSDDGGTWSTPQAAAAYSATDTVYDANPDVVCDGKGVWITVWDSTENLGGVAGTDQDIFMVRSTDNGATWSPATTLAPGASSDAGDDFGPTLATDREGHWVAAWSNYDQMSDIVVSTSANGGVTWSSPTGLRVIADSGQDFVPRLQTNRIGTWIVVWESGSSLGNTIGDDQDILFCRSTDNGSSWTAPAPVNSNAGSINALDAMPDLTTDYSGNWIVAWHSENPLGGTLGADADILYAYSNDDGQGWSAERTFATVAGDDTGSDTAVSLETNGHGAWLTVWTSDNDLGIAAGTDSDIAVAMVRDPLLPDAPRPLNSNAAADTGSDNYPRIATDGQGNCVAVWMSTDDRGATIGTDLDILVARSSDGGATWSQPAALNSNAGVDNTSDRDPVVATDGSGVWIVVWAAAANVGGTGTDQDIFMARSTNNGQTWSTLTHVNTYATTDNDSDFDPALATDGAGNWVVTWTTGLFDTITAASTNGGTSWNTPVLLAASSGADFEPTIATDRTGLWLVAWSSNHDTGGIGNDDDIMFCSSTNVGASWTAPAPLNITAASDDPEEDDFAPSLATDSMGNWVCAWHREGGATSTLGADSDVIVASSTNNAVTWSALLPISVNATTDSSEDHFASIANDRDGNWFVIWASGTPALGHSATFDTEVVGARSTDVGATWTPAAAVNSNAHADSGGGDFNATLVALGPGRWLTAWASTTNLGNQIGTDRDILFSIASIAEPSGGPIVNLGGGCGAGGSIRWEGAPAIGNPDVVVRLTGADPAANFGALGISGAGAPTRICGGCTISNYYFALLSTNVAGGAASINLPLPCIPTLRGLGFELQWVVVAPNQRPCSMFPWVAFSGRVGVTLDY